MSNPHRGFRFPIRALAVVLPLLFPALATAQQSATDQLLKEVRARIPNITTEELQARLATNPDIHPSRRTGSPEVMYADLKDEITGLQQSRINTRKSYTVGPIGDHRIGA